VSLLIQVTLGKFTSLAISLVGFVYTTFFPQEMTLSRYNPFNCQDCQFITRITYISGTKWLYYRRIAKYKGTKFPVHTLLDRISVFSSSYVIEDRLCGLVVRIPGYRSGGPAFDSQHYKKKVVGLERSPLSLVSATEELLASNGSGSGLESREYGRGDSSR
jgi:hypothetical protein